MFWLLLYSFTGAQPEGSVMAFRESVMVLKGSVMALKMSVMAL